MDIWYKEIQIVTSKTYTVCGGGAEKGWSFCMLSKIAVISLKQTANTVRFNYKSQACGKHSKEKGHPGKEKR